MAPLTRKFLQLFTTRRSPVSSPYTSFAAKNGYIRSTFQEIDDAWRNRTSIAKQKLPIFLSNSDRISWNRLINASGEQISREHLPFLLKLVWNDRSDSNSCLQLYTIGPHKTDLSSNRTLKDRLPISLSDTVKPVPNPGTLTKATIDLIKARAGPEWQVVEKNIECIYSIKDELELSWDREYFEEYGKLLGHSFTMKNGYKAYIPCLSHIFNIKAFGYTPAHKDFGKLELVLEMPHPLSESLQIPLVRVNSPIIEDNFMRHKYDTTSELLCLCPEVLECDGALLDGFKYGNEMGALTHDGKVNTLVVFAQYKGAKDSLFKLVRDELNLEDSQCPENLVILPLPKICLQNRGTSQIVPLTEYVSGEQFVKAEALNCLVDELEGICDLPKLSGPTCFNQSGSTLAGILNKNHTILPTLASQSLARESLALPINLDVIRGALLDVNSLNEVTISPDIIGKHSDLVEILTSMISWWKTTISEPIDVDLFFQVHSNLGINSTPLDYYMIYKTQKMIHSNPSSSEIEEFLGEVCLYIEVYKNHISIVGDDGVLPLVVGSIIYHTLKMISAKYPKMTSFFLQPRNFTENVLETPESYDWNQESLELSKFFMSFTQFMVQTKNHVRDWLDYNFIWYHNEDVYHLIKERFDEVAPDVSKMMLLKARQLRRSLPILKTGRLLLGKKVLCKALFYDDVHDLMNITVAKEPWFQMKKDRPNTGEGNPLLVVALGTDNKKLLNLVERFKDTFMSGIVSVAYVKAEWADPPYKHKEVKRYNLVTRLHNQDIRISAVLCQPYGDAQYAKIRSLLQRKDISGVKLWWSELMGHQENPIDTGYSDLKKPSVNPLSFRKKIPKEELQSLEVRRARAMRSAKKKRGTAKKMRNEYFEKKVTGRKNSL